MAVAYDMIVGRFVGVECILLTSTEGAGVSI